MNKQGDYGLKFNIPSMGNFEKRIQFVVKNLETGAFFSSVFFKQCDYFMRISINMFILLYTVVFLIKVIYKLDFYTLTLHMLHCLGHEHIYFSFLTGKCMEQRTV